jgi:hypothetical protein
VSVVCSQVEFSATGCSLVQRSPTECSVSECDREASVIRRVGALRAVVSLGGGEGVTKKVSQVPIDLEANAILNLQIHARSCART